MPEIHPACAAGEQRDHHPSGGATLERTPLAALTGLHKRYGKTVALAGLDLEIRSGELARFSVRTARKSTAISLWLGLIEADAGRGAAARWLSARRRVTASRRGHDAGSWIDARAARPGADRSHRELPSRPPHDRAGARTDHARAAGRPAMPRKLSAGQKRQVQFALAICGRPHLLFLDEPTVGLDIEARRTYVANDPDDVGEGCSIVLTTPSSKRPRRWPIASRCSQGPARCGGWSIKSVGRLPEAVTCGPRSPRPGSRWPNVVGVRGEAGRLEITVVDGEDVLRRLLASDRSIRDLEVRRAGLAEAFVENARAA